MHYADKGYPSDAGRHHITLTGWILVHDVPGDDKGVDMAILVLFYALVALLSLGLITMGRWYSLLGVVLFAFDGWAFWVFLEALKR